MTAGLKERIEGIQSRIRSACERVEREPQSVRLIAVSKMQPADLVATAYELGVRDFGENYIQELVSKTTALAHLTQARWHCIGPLQSNKIGKALQAASVIHTLDSRRHVEEVERRARTLGIRVECFIAVNVGAEDQKSGASESDLADLVAFTREQQAIELVGLMTIPPQAPSAEETRPYFRRLRELGQAHGLSRLSMGMSSDFEVAIEEGATDVRVGTSLFGSRS